MSEQIDHAPWYHEPIYLTAVLPPQKASSVEPGIGPELSILN
jgi:hypothetical protein